MVKLHDLAYPYRKKLSFSHAIYGWTLSKVQVWGIAKNSSCSQRYRRDQLDLNVVLEET